MHASLSHTSMIFLFRLKTGESSILILISFRSVQVSTCIFGSFLYIFFQSVCEAWLQFHDVCMFINAFDLYIN